MTILKINETYENFKLVNIEDVKEINSKVHTFEHIKTGTKLIFLENDDNNKTFSITFRTPPYDSTGLPHILEHSVLCGSEKYPIKDPFAQLVKGSIQSFLNAFTFPDKTMYPFSTTNEEEYHKLMNVYLDAVFYPNIHNKEEIFLQEGWRYELTDKSEPLKYSGVVYGEMKGAYSTPERIIESFSQNELLPETCYGVDSGGDPKDLTSLKYEDFLTFHKKYYHPSNSYIYLYGNLNILNTLKSIDENYLSGFSHLEIDSRIQLQKPFSQLKESTKYYQINKEEDEGEKSMFSLSYVIGKAIETELMLGFQILSSILLKFESSPLKKALIKAGFAQDIYGGFQEDLIYQPIFNIIAKNCDSKNKELFKTIIFNTLNDILDTGLDKDLITAAINKREFLLKDGKFLDDDHLNKGIQYSIKVMDSWLYDFTPTSHLKYFEMLKNIKNNISNKYFENLIEKYLLNNTHCVLVELKPDKNLDFEEIETKKLEEIKNSLSKEELEEIIQKTLKVQDFQNTPSSNEDLDKIKIIGTEKIDKLPQKINYEIKKENSTTWLTYKIKNNSINYYDFCFDTSFIKQDKIQYLTLVSQLLPFIKTKNYEYNDFANLTNTYLGSLQYDVRALENKKGELQPKFILATKLLDSNQGKLYEILNEIFSNVEFEFEKVKEILIKIKSRMQSSIISQGHRYSLKRLSSKVSTMSHYDELTTGISYYEFVSDLLANFENNKEEIIKNIVEIYTNIFNENNLIINVVGDNLELEKITFKTKKLTSKEYTFNLNEISEAFSTSSQVNYVGKGYDYKKLGFNYSGSLLVLQNYLRYTYLWENVRVKNGAYGALARLNEFGSFYLVSYRDPNIKKTLEVYDKLANHLKNINLDEKELRRQIIGVIAELDSPREIDDLILDTLFDYVCEITYEDKIKERTQILNTTLKDLRSYSNLVELTMKKNLCSCVGSDSSIEKNKSYFNIVKNI